MMKEHRPKTVIRQCEICKQQTFFITFETDVCDDCQAKIDAEKLNIKVNKWLRWLKL
jgi:hypothetical protein